jgi:hypothetical protein
MSVYRKSFVASIALSLCAISSLAFAQTTPNNETQGMPSANPAKSNVTKEERQAARKERRAVGAEVAKENIKNPPNYEVGKSGAPNATSTTRAERVAARKERSAAGAEISKENVKNPVNNETGKPAGK